VNANKVWHRNVLAKFTTKHVGRFYVLQKYITFWFEKTLRTRGFGQSRSRWEDNSKMELFGLFWERSSCPMETWDTVKWQAFYEDFNPLNAELNPICHLLALLGVHFLHFRRIRVKSLTLRLLMSHTYIYTGCNRRKGQNFGRVFLMLKYTDITQNTYIQSWTVREIMAREVWNFDSCYTLIDYQIHIKTGRNMWFL